MKIKVVLDKIKIGKLLQFSGGFLEMAYMNNTCVLMSESEDYYTHTLLGVLEHSNESFHIRIPTALLKGLNSEISLDVVVWDSDVDLIFYGSKSKFMYKTKIRKQRGFVDFTSYLNLRNNRSNYSSYSTKDLAIINNYCAKLNVNIMCTDNILYSTFMRCYIFRKCELPNFNVKSDVMKKCVSSCSVVYFIDTFIHFNIQDVDIDVFIKKLRVPEISDINYILESKFSASVELDSSNIVNVFKRITVSDNAIISLNLEKGYLTVEDSDSSIEIDTPILDMNKVESKTDNVPSDEELLQNLIEGKSEAIELQTGNGLPTIKLPKWLIARLIDAPTVKVYLNRNFVVFNIAKVKILINRSE